MSKDVRIVPVEIFGQIYNLRADGDPAYVVDLAAHVDAKMREVAKETKAVDTLRVAILAALNIADEARRNAPRPADVVARGDADIERRADEWTRILDDAIAR